MQELTSNHQLELRSSPVAGPNVVVMPRPVRQTGSGQWVNRAALTGSAPLGPTGHP